MKASSPNGNLRTKGETPKITLSRKSEAVNGSSQPQYKNTMLGAHVRLEPSALENGRFVLRSAMDFGFVGPLDIPTEHFHPDLQSTAGVIRNARDQGSRDFSDVILHLIQTTQPGDAQDVARAKVADIGECMTFRPEDLIKSAEIVRNYHLVKSRVHAGYKLQKTLEAGDDPAGVLGEIVALESGSVSVAQSRPFEFFHADQLAGTNEPMDFVEGLLTKGGASLVYGKSNCGKSFWIVDLGACVASGTRFRDELEVEQGAVVYIALEGSHGAKNRIEALKRQGKLKPGAPFYLIFESVSLLETGHANRLAETVAKIAEDARMPVKLVILDTMARAMAGGDENSGKDMTAAVQSIDAIRAATGAHVAVVHHCGKDEARGARGHSSLRAAVDTEIEVSRAEGQTVSTVRVTKQRDLQAAEAMPFSLEVITLGTDRRGKPMTSCIVRHEDEMMAAAPGKAGRKPTCTPEEMLRYLPAASVSEWQKRVKEETGLAATQFYSHKKHLEAGNRIRKTPTGLQAA